MNKNRVIFILASAVLWSGAIYSVSQLKPKIYNRDTPDTPPIKTLPIVVVKKDPPPPPPVKIKEKEPPVKQVNSAVSNPTKIFLVDTDIVPTEQTGTTTILNTQPTDNIDLPPSLGDINAENIEPIIVVADTCREQEQVPLPRSQFNVERAYPVQLEEKGVTGVVKAIWQIDKNGMPIDINIASSTHEGFNTAVLREGMKMRFKPARKECENIKGIYSLNVIFELTEQ